MTTRPMVDEADGDTWDLRLRHGLRYGWVVVEVVGELDTTNAEMFWGFLADCLRTGATRMVVDLGNVDFVGRAGVYALVSTYQRLRRRGGELNVISDDANTLRRFHQAGLGTLITVLPSVPWPSDAPAGPPSP
ncbi:anti-sigma factor antagonist [Actinoalloteichus sp. AHMU CJ021]|uniref:Anti-sigma factor antagonist n=1 Tax=Actinoalloteichus caeruleus DSM 43889 TaxID=1120930 RepID=A0ABT1JHQ5_ACTCY|nr:STAS domain-containing protein [Actinoalloteichus caeruleus]AUS78054.1 anti-sigma factor antagonist [Actinoalloteichus sp. AHMU CJ021]MCP2332046.1 anti-sigma B factor antagonist [Actinoalloteichus caeruleus DSM 43889]